MAEFPLWRVPLDGITVSTPVPLYKKLVTLEASGIPYPTAGST